MNSDSAHGEKGQALVIVALALFVLMGTIALSVDWGYSLLTRRGAQNEADAAALGAGRKLASSYLGGASPFEISQEDVWCEARQRRDANSRSAPTGLARSLTVSFYSSTSGTLPLDEIATANCGSLPGTRAVPPATAFVRVRLDTTYSSLFGAVTRGPVKVSTSARVRLTAGAGVRDLDVPALYGAGRLSPGPGLSGCSEGQPGCGASTTRPSVAIWPIVRYFDPSEFATPSAPCGQYCTPSTARRVTLWPDARCPSFSTPGCGSFSGLVTFAHFSPREAPDVVHQLVTESDYTGTTNGHHGHTATLPLDNWCGIAASWDTNGSTDLAQAASCDIPNWFHYGYRGSVGLGTDWSAAPWAEYVGSSSSLPADLPAGRAACTPRAPEYFPKPSCTGTPSRGDWVETVPADVSPGMAAQMQSFVRTYGRLVPNANGRGPAVVVHVFLWDCAEHFIGRPPVGSHWSRLTSANGDGVDVGQNCGRPSGPRSIDRVHLVSVVPFTIYENLITTSPPRIDAYWGDVFGDAGTCGATPPSGNCALNPLINSAFLVPDE
jgi:hypothetical protein